MSENNNKHNESSAPKFLAETQELTTDNETLSSKVLVVGRNKNITNEEFDMRDKTHDHEAAEVWSILTLLMADEKKYSVNGK